MTTSSSHAHRGGPLGPPAGDGVPGRVHHQHALENIVLLDTDSVKAFVGEYHPEHYLLKAENPLAVGAYDLGCHYMEHKVQQAEAMKAAKARILEVAARFEALTGRKYGLFEAYRMEDAEVALVLIGSSAGTAKVAVDQLREQGVKAGLVKIRVFRPFPAQELAQALAAQPDNGHLRRQSESSTRPRSPPSTPSAPSCFASGGICWMCPPTLPCVKRRRPRSSWTAP